MSCLLLHWKVHSQCMCTGGSKFPHNTLAYSIIIKTHDVSHLTCWCWAVPDSVTAQRVPALHVPLGYHGWRSCGRTVERRWSPHRSPPHPSSLTHLTIAGPGTHAYAYHKHRGTWTHTNEHVLHLLEKWLKSCAVCPKQLCTMDASAVYVDKKKVTQPCTRSIHPSLLLSYSLIPHLIYFNLRVGYRRHRGGKFLHKWNGNTNEGPLELMQHSSQKHTLKWVIMAQGRTILYSDVIPLGVSTAHDRSCVATEI